MATPQVARKATSGSISFLPPYYTDGKEQSSPVKDQSHREKPHNLEDKFEDPYGARLGKAARFWRVYVQESNMSDEELSKGWNQMLDVILLFVRAYLAESKLVVDHRAQVPFVGCLVLFYLFIMESLKYLRPDETARTNEILVIMSRSLIAMSNQSIPLPTEAMMDSPAFTPPNHAIIANTLWFLSLMISLSVTLISILAKEWCHVYMAGRTGPMHDQARRRQQRFDGLKRWRMKGLIAFLPTLMHIALFLFTIGLSIHLWCIYNAVAVPVITFTATMTLLYLAATILPFISEFCPYTTALSRLLTDIWLKGRNKIYDISDVPSDNIPMDIVTSRALSWVISHCENETSVDIALQAIAGADHSLPCEPLWKCNAASLISQRLHGCLMAEGLPVTNSGFESLVQLGRESLTFRLCVLYARVLNVLAWDGTKDSFSHSTNVFRDIWSEFELLYDNLSKYSDSEISSSTTVGYAGISVWRQHRPYIMSNFSKGANSPLGVSSYILLVLERQKGLQSYEAQLYELFYVLQCELMDSDISSIQRHPAYKQNLVSNLVLILKFMSCDTLLSDFGFVAQVLAASGLILNGHHPTSEALYDKIGRYAVFDEVEPELLLFLGLVGLIEASESTNASLTEDISSSPELDIVFERLIQLKVFLVSNTQGLWPSPALCLPFQLGNASTFNDYALNIISTYYYRYANTTSISQGRCVGFAAGLIVASVVGKDCILDNWRPIATSALPQSGNTAALRWVYPNTRSHAILHINAPFLDVALFAVLNLLKNKPEVYTQQLCLIECFHDIADQLYAISRRLDEPVVNDLLQKVVEEGMLEPLVRALLTIRPDHPSSKTWRGIDAEPKLAWWGARIIWLVHQSIRWRENSEDGAEVASAVEAFCHAQHSTSVSKEDTELEPGLPTIPEDDKNEAATPNSFSKRLRLFKFVLLGEMRDPSRTQDLLEDVEEIPELKRSWTHVVQRTRRKLSGHSDIAPYSTLV